MELSRSQQLEQPLRIKLEPLEEEPDWPGIAVELDLGPEMLGSEPVKQEPEDAIKAEAGWPGGPEQVARAGSGPGRWLAAVRLSAADRVAAEAQLPRQQSPALAPVKETFTDPELEFADQTNSSGGSDAEPGAQTAEEREPPKPFRWTWGLVGPGTERSCQQCQIHFHSWQQLQQHTAAQHPDSTARSCTDHSQTLSRSSAQQQPVRSANRKDNHLQCQQCGKECVSPSALQLHERVHTGEKPHLCPQCGRGFALLRNLQQHERTHTGARPYTCPDCGQQFSQAGNMRAHQRTHTGARPYLCSHCGKTFTQPSNLKEHEAAVHRQERLHACPDCGQRFSQAGNLQSHQKAVHLNQRPHACPDCDRRFAQKYDLRRHARTHSGAQPHVCEVCSRRFSDISSLRRHSLIHSGQKPFSCNSCGRSFREKAHLRQHTRIHLRALRPGPASAR